MQIENAVTQETQDVLTFLRKKKQWFSLEKAIEYANSYFYNMSCLTIHFPSGVIFYCQHEE
ncbi:MULTISPECIES: hypothetical protein [Snodgrassella]|uniref:hypothetical protein n=1 Tax=Snodgrassella TaxID=1193515 RepID=UPI0008158461|nr:MULTISPECIES: hypothetical protein [Snodgrassella]MCO6521222.1 hypothetical protein [Snodgrassella sp.]SCC04092.1 hypothetical protein GA0061082_10711 [Snodgrassella sp. R-53583]